MWAALPIFASNTDEHKSLLVKHNEDRIAGDKKKVLCLSFVERIAFMTALNGGSFTTELRMCHTVGI